MFRGRVVAVVIPARNEADKIAATIRSVPGFVDHVVVVDDGSGDATAANARREASPSGPLSPRSGERGRREASLSGPLSPRSGERGRREASLSGPLSPRSGERVRERGRVEVVVHDRNRGVGAAIATGYARALALGAHATAVMAGDGQMDPADLPRLLAPVVGGQADYAKGNRFAWPGGWRMMPPVRMIGSVVLSWLTGLASGYRHVRDSQCGYTVASRHALLAIGPDLFARYGYPNDLLARLAAARVRVVDVPVRPVYGPAWRSGLRPLRVAPAIAWLLLRAFGRRMRARWRGTPAVVDGTAGVAAPS